MDGYEWESKPNACVTADHERSSDVIHTRVGPHTILTDPELDLCQIIPESFIDDRRSRFMCNPGLIKDPCGNPSAMHDRFRITFWKEERNEMASDNSRWISLGWDPRGPGPHVVRSMAPMVLDGRTKVESKASEPCEDRDMKHRDLHVASLGSVELKWTFGPLVETENC